MRFEEVTHLMLGAEVSYPGSEYDQKKLRDAIPGMQTMRVWGARHGGYTWSISYEPGNPKWSEEDKKKWIGYTCSYRRLEHNSSSQTIKVDGVFKSFSEAESACKRVWKQLRQPQ